MNGLFGRLLRGLDNPIVAKEAISRMRTWRAPLAISIYSGLLGGLGYAMFALLVLSTSYNRLEAARIGSIVFYTLAFFQLVLVVLFSPALAAGAISGERERQTFDTLLVSRVSSFAVVWGKLFASLAYELLLILTSLPLFAVVFLFGGVDLEQFVLTQLITVVTAVTVGSVAIFWSSLFRRTLAATVSAYGSVFALYAGTAALGLILTYLAYYTQYASGSAPGGGDSSLNPLLFGNPFYALNVILTQASGNPTHLGRLWQLLVFGTGKLSASGPLLEPWQLAVLSQTALSALCVAGSVWLVRGRRALPLPRRRPLAAVPS
ncbi:MAG TPA: ABC transporter permease subunit [Candidatus Acidoferrales bacterium]|nr:ABC transporter permease subunit [Candidatus Acidoferrales bacterium]